MIVKIDNVQVGLGLSDSKSIKVSFSYSDDVKCFITRDFVTKYSYDIDGVPYGIAVIPFVCNVLPIVWLMDGTLVCDELDYDFYHSVDDFKKGYQEMYPNLYFGGKIECKVASYDMIQSKNQSMVFFSGGVDAFATLFAHINERLVLFTICGADIRLDNKKGWSFVVSHIKDVSDEFSLPSVQCCSNFRDFIDECFLCKMVSDKGAKDDWWHGFQHGIGLIGHAAPLAYKYGIANNYIASSYTIRDRSYITCASDPRIDNFVRFCGSRVVHDQFESNRQEKIAHIVEFCKQKKKKVFLRVCWSDDEGNNCCRCEKCYRTIAGLLAVRENLEDYGFNNVDLKRMKHDLKYKIVVSKHSIQYWQDIQKSINSKNTKTQIEWLRNYNVEKLYNNMIKQFWLNLKSLKRFLIRSFGFCH